MPPLRKCLMGQAVLLSVLGSFAQAAPPVVYDIPHVNPILIDGDPADWADHGLKINVLASNADHPAPEDLDARARLAWTDESLLLLLSVTDDGADEADNMEAAWMRDSIEVFVADKVGGSTAATFVISPGIAASQPQLRIKSTDRRGKAMADKPLKCTAAVRRTADGYTAEIAIPWSNLGLTARSGLETAIQFNLNDADPEKPRKRLLLWYPVAGAGGSTERMHTIRLADAPSRPIDYSASVSDLALRGLRVSFAARGLYPSRTLKVLRGDVEVTSGPATQAGDLVTASARLPLPPLGVEAGTLQIRFGDTIQADLDVPNLDKARLQAFERLAIRPSAYVFTGNAFPGFDFENVERAENLVGSYTLSARFFDAAMNEVQKPTSFGRYGAVLRLDVPNQPSRYRYVTLCRAKHEIDPDLWRPRVDLPLNEVLDVDNPVMPAEAEALSDMVRSSVLEAMRRNENTASLVASLYDGSGSVESVTIQESRWWFELRKKIGHPYDYRYLHFIPKGAPDQKRPAILFLHGSGERGDDLSKLENSGPRAYAKGDADFPFILISPQCPWGEWWNPVAVDALVKDLLEKYPIDPDRFYLTGLSMGGYGAWATASLTPNRFAAVVPICGGGNPRDVISLADTPVWVVHGGKDTAVRPSQSFRLVQALREQQGRVRFTFYPDRGHDTWTPTYNDPRLYEWMLNQHRGRPTEPQANEATTRPTEIR